VRRGEGDLGGVGDQGRGQAEVGGDAVDVRARRLRAPQRPPLGEGRLGHRDRERAEAGQRRSQPGRRDASGQFYIEKQCVLLVFAGIWALFQGVSDVFKAFELRRLRPKS
jgi:hypothetical protein